MMKRSCSRKYFKFKMGKSQQDKTTALQGKLFKALYNKEYFIIETSKAHAFMSRISTEKIKGNGEPLSSVFCEAPVRTNESGGGFPTLPLRQS